MMDYTDRFCRYFLRLISKNTLLYTEMITTGALIHGDRNRFLAHDRAEYPLALQLGGNDAAELGACARMAEQAGYNEVNLNCGCPSDRVQNGAFGAVLMKSPGLVGDAVAAMKDATGALPITVKNRIGVDDMDSYQQLADFVGVVHERGCETFIVHARKAWLQGLSPKQNREIPPLQYDLVYRLKRDFPHLEIILNGGVATLDDVQNHLMSVDGVMIGREAYGNPYMLAHADRRFFQDSGPIPERDEILAAFIPFVERELANGTRLSHMTRHILGLYNSQPGGRKYRRFLSERAHRPGAGIEVLVSALEMMANYSDSPQARWPKRA